MTRRSIILTNLLLSLPLAGTLRGSFGYTITGTLVDSYAPPHFAGTFAEVDRPTFDGKGNTNTTAKETLQ
jgi:hypothetical protein